VKRTPDRSPRTFIDQLADDAYKGRSATADEQQNIHRRKKYINTELMFGPVKGNCVLMCKKGKSQFSTFSKGAISLKNPFG